MLAKQTQEHIKIIKYFASAKYFLKEMFSVHKPVLDID